MTNETQTAEQTQDEPATCFLVSDELMQLVMGCLGEQKLKDTGGLYIQLLQTPRIETAQLQKALDSIQSEEQPKKEVKTNAK